MKPILTVSRGDYQKRIDLVQGSLYYLGRDSSADIVLEEKKISRRHASLLWNDNNEVILTDLKSLNGTLLNGEKLTGSRSINDADSIQIGSFYLQIHYNQFDGVSLAQVDSKDVSIIRANYRSQFGPKPPKETKENSEKRLSEEVFGLDDISAHDGSSEETAGRIIHGRIEEITLADVIQLLSSSKKSGQLAVSSKKMTFPPKQRSRETASLFIREGSLVAAVYDELVGEEAFFETLKFEKGFFTLFPHDSFHFPNPILTPLESLLLEGMRRLDEERRDSKASPKANRFEAVPEQPLTDLDPDQLQILQLVWKYKEIDRVLEESSLETEITNSIIRILEKKGYIKRT